MVWTVVKIEEADFGCEERMPGEPLMDLVTLQCDDGRCVSFEVPDQWLLLQEIEEGDEWPEDPEEPDAAEETADRQADWMDNYFEAVREMEEDV